MFIQIQCIENVSKFFIIRQVQFETENDIIINIVFKVWISKVVISHFLNTNSIKSK